MRGSGADEPEWGANMNLLDDVPGVVRKSVKHFVIGEASYTKPSKSVNRALTLREHGDKPLLTM